MATKKQSNQMARDIGLGLSMPDYPHAGKNKGQDKTTTRSEKSKILRSMHMNINHSWTFWQSQYDRASEDIEFAYKSQWRADAKAEREAQGRPVLSPTLIPQYINRIAGVARQSKFSIHIQQVGGPNEAAIKAASGDVLPFSEVMEGLIRDIEAKSMATLKYSRALQHSVEGGIGWLRARIFYGPHDPFNAEIGIEHVRDRQSVIMDHLAEHPLLRDANYGWISKWMDWDDFKEAYGDVKQTDWSPGDIAGDGVTGFYHRSRFFNDNAVRVAEYYWKEPTEKVSLKLVNEEKADELVIYEDDVPEDLLDELMNLGYEEVDRVNHKTYDVKSVLCTGDKILEGPYTWPGKEIPLYPVIGRQIDDGYDNTEYHSLHRYSHDSQRMYSWFATKAVERVAQAPNAQWIADYDTISSYEQQWEDANVTNRNVLFYEHDEDKPPPQRLDGAQIPAAEIQLLQIQHQNMMQAIGLTDSSLGRKSNETSGAAIQQRQMAGEYGSLEFVDNLTYAIASLGDCICELIPHVYSDSKIKRLIMADDTQIQVILNQKLTDPETGTTHTFNQIGLARFAATSVAGPAFATQRQEMMEMMMELAKTNPQTVGIAFDIIVKAMDFPGGEALVRRLRAAVPRDLLTKEEQKTLPEPTPTPEQELQQLELQTQQKEAESKAMVAQAEMAKAQMMQMQYQLEMEKLQIETDRAVKVGELQVEEKQAMLDQENVEYEKKKLELEMLSKEKQIESQDKESGSDEDLESKIVPIVRRVLAEQKSTEMQKSRTKTKKAA